jgi:hypothetical protein
MNYLDDRKEKKLRDEMERQRRQAMVELAERRAQDDSNSATTPIDQRLQPADGDLSLRESSMGASGDLDSDDSDESERSSNKLQ